MVHANCMSGRSTEHSYIANISLKDFINNTVAVFHSFLAFSNSLVALKYNFKTAKLLLRFFVKITPIIYMY